jgi:hypothetical protein
LHEDAVVVINPQSAADQINQHRELPGVIHQVDESLIPQADLYMAAKRWIGAFCIGQIWSVL